MLSCFCGHAVGTAFPYGSIYFVIKLKKKMINNNNNRYLVLCWSRHRLERSQSSWDVNRSETKCHVCYCAVRAVARESVLFQALRLHWAGARRSAPSYQGSGCDGDCSKYPKRPLINREHLRSPAVVSRKTRCYIILMASQMDNALCRV